MKKSHSVINTLLVQIKKKATELDKMLDRYETLKAKEKKETSKVKKKPKKSKSKKTKVSRSKK